MCGIAGCIGKNANEIVLTGLKRLEYRGYDSCGVAFFNDNVINVEKSIDRVADLTANVKFESNMSIGHTRWATHGGVTIQNCHPHNSERFVGVHNGVIENYKQLTKMFGDVTLVSQTDTEIIVNYFNFLFAKYNDFNKSAVEFMENVHGSYALLLMDKTDSNKMYVLKNKTPIVVGISEDNITVSSDPIAVFDVADEFYRLENHEFVEITADSSDIKVFNAKGNSVDYKFETVVTDELILDTEGYDSFMLKEIEEQPRVIKNIIKQYENFEIDANLKNDFLNAPKIYIVASGTSYHAGLVLRRMFSRDLNKPTEVVIGSEFGYDDNIIPDGSMFVYISQSGETADSMVVFNRYRGQYKTLAITNVRGSQLDSNCDYSLLLHAGVEIAVASTKAYVANIAVGYLVTGALKDSLATYATELEKVIEVQTQVITDKDKFQELSVSLKDCKSMIGVGRLHDYDIMMENALKIKEITYININAYGAGELKHGPISLIDKDMHVLSLITNKNVADASRSNVQEIKARDGVMTIFSLKSLSNEDDFYSFDFEGDELLTPTFAAIPFQYLSYFIAKELDLDVDKPRNLAKSVTVE